MHPRPRQQLGLLTASLALATCASSCAAYGFQDRPGALDVTDTPPLTIHTIDAGSTRGADLRRATRALVDAARRCGVDARWGSGGPTSATLTCDATSVEQSSTDGMTLARGELRCVLTDSRGATELVAQGSSTRGGLANDVFAAMTDAQTDAIIDAARHVGCDAARTLTKTAPRADHGQKTSE